MNVAMWRKALRVIPHVSKEEWERLDVISRWLISTRAAVLIMTFLSTAIAGILAIQSGSFNFWYWLLVTIGLIMAHATNNLLNDYTDYVRGVDQDNYYRAQYGPQPLVHGLNQAAIADLCGGDRLDRPGLRGDPGVCARWFDPATARAGGVLCVVLHLAAQVYRPG